MNNKNNQQNPTPVVSPIKLEEINTLPTQSTKEKREAEQKYYSQSIYEAPQDELENL